MFRLSSYSMLPPFKEISNESSIYSLQLTTHLYSLFSDIMTPNFNLFRWLLMITCNPPKQYQGLTKWYLVTLGLNLIYNTNKRNSHILFIVEIYFFTPYFQLINIMPITINLRNLVYLP